MDGWMEKWMGRWMNSGINGRNMDELDRWIDR